MKILHILPSLNKSSGVANAAMNLYRNIDRERFSFDFLCFWDAPENYNEEVKACGGQAFLFTKPSLRHYSQSKRELNRFFHEHSGEYDIIHCHEILLARIIFPIARENGVKVCISHAHSTKFADKFLNAIRNRLLCRGLKNISDYCLACSCVAGVKIFGKNMLVSGKFEVLHNGIEIKKHLFDLDGRKTFRKEFGIQKQTFLIAHAGRFTKSKNHKFLIKVFRIYHKKNINAKLILAGNGLLQKKIKKNVQKKKLTENVIFAGVIKDIPSLLAAADCFIFPSKFEGLGIAVVEAQASGLKCLASDKVPHEAGVTNLIDFLPLKSVNNWAQAIKANDIDTRVCYNKILENNNYDAVRTAARLEEIYIREANK